MEIGIVRVTETPHFSLMGTETSGLFCFYFVYTMSRAVELKVRQMCQNIEF